MKSEILNKTSRNYELIRPNDAKASNSGEFEASLSRREHLRLVNRFLVVKIEKCFLAKMKMNPSYSLRAFAKYLGVDQSYLSKVLKGQNFFSESSIRKITPKLGLSPLEEVQLWDGHDNTIKDFHLLEEERFQLMANWNNFAVLELIKTQSFVATPDFIAKRLDIHIEEARSILKRLEMLGFIHIEEGQITLLLPNNSWTNNLFTSEARKQLQNDLIDKSKKALNEIHYLDRDHGSLTVAIDRKRMPEFKEKLAKIRKDLDQFFQSSGDFNEVYQLTLSFFPLTQLEPRHEK